MSNLLDYSTWTEGTGSVTGWSAYGTNLAYENVRLYAPDPWNKSAIVWQIRSEDNTQYGGGFPSSVVSVDTNYDYRFTAYVNRLGAVGERTLFGCNAYNGGVNTYIKRLGTAFADNNPYFNHWYNSLYLNEWLLIVGFIRKSSTIVSDVKHADGGVWRLTGQKIETSDYEFWFDTTTYTYTGVRMRLFYYDSTDKWPEFVENVAYPRIEKVDGTELSLANLLRGPYPMLLGTSSGLGSALIKVKEWH